MKYKFRGQLNNGSMVDIFYFEGDFAKCDHGKGNIHINEFNTIFLPRETFKKEILGKDVKDVKNVKEVKFEKINKKSK